MLTAGSATASAQFGQRTRDVGEAPREPAAVEAGKQLASNLEYLDVLVSRAVSERDRLQVLSAAMARIESVLGTDYAAVKQAG